MKEVYLQTVHGWTDPSLLPVLTKVRFSVVLALAYRYSHYSEKNPGFRLPDEIFSL